MPIITTENLRIAVATFLLLSHEFDFLLTEDGFFLGWEEEYISISDRAGALATSTVVERHNTGHISASNGSDRVPGSGNITIDIVSKRPYGVIE